MTDLIREHVISAFRSILIMTCLAGCATRPDRQTAAETSTAIGSRDQGGPRQCRDVELFNI